MTLLLMVSGILVELFMVKKLRKALRNSKSPKVPWEITRPQATTHRWKITDHVKLKHTCQLIRALTRLTKRPCAWVNESSSWWIFAITVFYNWMEIHYMWKQVWLSQGSASFSETRKTWSKRGVVVAPGLRDMIIWTCSCVTFLPDCQVL